VRHTNSVFHDILKLVPWAAFDRLVDEYGTDEAARRFTTRNQFLVLFFAQFGGVSSLREVEAVMASHQARLYHAGAKAPKRSTFADANRNRDPRVFSKLFEPMLAASPRGLRRKMGEAVRLIDSTSLRLAGAGAQWARFSSGVFGVKSACHLGSGPRPPGLSGGDSRQRQRHHRRQADADRPWRHLMSLTWVPTTSPGGRSSTARAAVW
jgi:hypothetical protein